MNHEQVGIATITLTRGALEEQLLRESLRRLAGLGMPVVAADGGSRAEFLEFLRNLGMRVVRPRKPGLIPQVQLSLATAARELRRPYLLYTEPDKVAFFGDPLLKFVGTVRAGKRFGMALAARDPWSFATFPEWQRFTETTINRIAADVTGQEADYCYGPLLFPASEAERIRQVPEDLGWGWRFFLLGQLSREKRKITALELRAPCPEDQRAEGKADRLYRTKQLRQNINGLSLGAAV